MLIYEEEDWLERTGNIPYTNIHDSKICKREVLHNKVTQLHYLHEELHRYVQQILPLTRNPGVLQWAETNLI